MTEFDCNGTRSIVCPHCGDQHDPTDFVDRGTCNCEECGKPFRYEASYDVTYSTSCVDHSFGEWQLVHGVPARFCVRCGTAQLQERTAACPNP